MRAERPGLICAVPRSLDLKRKTTTTFRSRRRCSRRAEGGSPSVRRRMASGTRKRPAKGAAGTCLALLCPWHREEQAVLSPGLIASRRRLAPLSCIPLLSTASGSLAQTVRFTEPPPLRRWSENGARNSLRQCTRRPTSRSSASRRPAGRQGGGGGEGEGRPG